MELKTKKQFSYLIYPYVIDENNYDGYIMKLLKNKRCRLKIWDKKDDLSLYTYFSKNIKDSIFWSFSYSDGRKEKLDELDYGFRSKILAQNQAIMFEYSIGNNMQGKIGENILFFDINKIDIVCFKTGICFVILKTTLGPDSSFCEVLNANSKFRNVSAEFKTLKEDEKIKVQASEIRDTIDLSEVIKDIIGKCKDAKELKISEERILTYSFTCLDKDDWNENTNFGKELENRFTKFYKVLPDGFPDESLNKDKNEILDINDFLKIGFSKQGTGVLCSDEISENTLKKPYMFEQEYLYTYLISLYKKLYINKVRQEFDDTKKFEKTRLKLEEFNEDIWIKPMTDNNEGIDLCRRWEKTMQLDYLFEKLKLNMRLQNNM